MIVFFTTECAKSKIELEEKNELVLNQQTNSYLWIATSVLVFNETSVLRNKKFLLISSWSQIFSLFLISNT